MALLVGYEARSGLWGLPAGTFWDAPVVVAEHAPVLDVPFWRDGAWWVSWSAPQSSLGVKGYQLRVQGRVVDETSPDVREVKLPAVPFSHRLVVEVRALFAPGVASPWSSPTERPLPPAADAVATLASAQTALHGGLENLLSLPGLYGRGYRRLRIAAAGTTPFGWTEELPSNLDVSVTYDPFRVPDRRVSGSDWTPQREPAHWQDGWNHGYDLVMMSGERFIWALTTAHFLNRAAGAWTGTDVLTATYSMLPSPSFGRNWVVTVRAEQPVEGEEIVEESLNRLASGPDGFGARGELYLQHLWDPFKGVWRSAQAEEFHTHLASRQIFRDADGRARSISVSRGVVRAWIDENVSASWDAWRYDGGVRLAWAAEFFDSAHAVSFHSLTPSTEVSFGVPLQEGVLTPWLVSWEVDVVVNPRQRALRDAGLVIYERRTLPVGGEGSVLFKGKWFDLCSSLILSWSGPFTCRLVDPNAGEAGWDSGMILESGEDLARWLPELRTGARAVVIRGLDVGSGRLSARASRAGAALQASCDLRAVPAPILLPDADRNGAITLESHEPDAVFGKAGHPWYFWINDDNDTGFVRDNNQRPSQDCPNQPEHKRDCSNAVVDGMRDLVDFFPFVLDVRAWSAAHDATRWRLVQQDGAVGCVVTAQTPGRAGEALAGSEETLKYQRAPVVPVTSSGWDLTDALRVARGQLVLLAEGRRATREPLRLEAWENGKLTAAVEMPLHIGPVESMYRIYNLRRIPYVNCEDPPGEDPGSRWMGGVGPPGFPDHQSDGTHFVAIHGLAFSLEEGRGFAAEIFKRFFQAGCRSMFHVILWRSDEGSGRPFGVMEEQTLDYHTNCVNAWVTGEALQPFLVALNGPVTVFTHSLGSVVAGRALSLGRPAGYRRLITLNGSAPLSAYFPGEGGANAVSHVHVLRHPDWRKVHPRFWASNWHKLFSGSPGDARARLTWSGQFASIPSVVNIFSSGDQVLRMPAREDFNLLQAIWNGEDEVWATQERLKGRRVLSLVRMLPGVSWRSDHGGWGFNPEWLVEKPRIRRPKHGGVVFDWVLQEGLDRSEEEGGVPDEVLATKPVFRRFDPVDPRYVDPRTGVCHYDGAALFGPIGSAAASNAASDSVLVGKLLAEAIPNLCAPLGGVSADGTALQGQGIDYCTFLGASWGPAGDRWSVDEARNKFKHSDYVNLPYAYLYSLYERILEASGP